MNNRKLVIVLKGYPRLSETFIAQELRGLEKAGFKLNIVALRRPTDTKRHPIHDEIEAEVHYLPEYLHDEPWRVLRAFLATLPTAGFWRAFAAFARDLPRDFTRNRVRRFGQALVLTHEWPQDGFWLHAHFAHTPASVTRYAALMLGMAWTCSAHAKDIWTSPDWELSEKLADARWTVTCTQSGFEHLRDLVGGRSAVHLSYHGLDLDRFGPYDQRRQMRDGSDAEQPVRIVSVGRAVEKKGFDTLLDALALLPPDLHWRLTQIGAGEKLAELKAQAQRLGIADRIEWKGALAQAEVLAQYRESDIFTLACRIAHDGDRDGLPNVLVEAASQALACVATDVSGIPELLTDGENGLVVPSENPTALAAALERAVREPTLRAKLGKAAEQRVRQHFDHHSSIDQLKKLFDQEWAKV
ncbi:MULTISPECIES: glycosyltransferase family 4 protein [Mesorhizobium]|uniref:Colanic acid biosynthesis glycosyltransferase WcaL n=1 Tax=Mesorhizobium denitrificans TaxID=2294114 RepID=A0A371X3X4_9HYPH|nr:MULTISPECIES: glycosyltransferase family 4 protein [Mesorhizobium]RFC63938.1 colanic acid biosynthesis glycosyltransferase WcaL [Mesorhizobium denitrificans]